MNNVALHCCYHRCMTTYFTRVFRAFAQRFSYGFATVEGAQSTQEAALVLAYDGRIPPSLSAFRGTHIIRDPRDMVVSAYFYHLRCAEEWCVTPNLHNEDLAADVSYQSHLSSLPRDDGIRYEMAHVTGGEIQKILNWDYDMKDFLELRFEEVLGNERKVFKQIFDWYGFAANQVQAASELASRCAAGRVRRYRDLLHRNRPIRIGTKIGQWRQYFTPQVKHEFKERFGDAVVRLGYEPSNDW